MTTLNRDTKCFNLLIYGSRGWIGGQFINILIAHNVNYTIGKSRVDNLNDLTNEINCVSPTHVVSFIGRTHGKIGDKEYQTIDYLEQDGKLFDNVRDNLYGPLNIATICKEKDIHYTYLGTGCIFKYDDDHPYGCEINGFTHDDDPNFFGSSYSIVKGFTDKIMKSFNNVLNVRIRMPITDEENKRNFITKIVNYDKICSVPNSMTVLPDLLPVVLDLIQKNHVGTVNLTNPGLISHNDILLMYKNIVDPDFSWKNFTQDEQRSILDADRSNNYLDTTFIENNYPHIQNIRSSVENCMISYKKSIIINKDMINLLVTGACGFIGSNFVNHYFPLKRCNKIVNIDAMYYCANEKNVDETIRNNSNYIFIKGNVADNELISNILVKYKITHIIHFAAQSHVQNSFNDSLTYTYDNVLGTHTLLECCRIYNKIQRFIHVSTDEVYGESMTEIDETQKTEYSILCPTNPYAATKAGAELIAQSYYHSFKFPIIITRGNNVYGPNQYPEKIIPLFIKLLQENKKVTIQGKGNAIRAFLHAKDTATAFQTILEKGCIGEIYNIGCDDNMEYTVMDVAKILIKKIKNTENYDEWIEYIEDRPFNDIRYYISNNKLKELGWSVSTSFNDGINDLLGIK
jgi:dTDP-glucose 4,6-dehydratase/UDP-glucose 4,6-dehydratase